MGRIEIIRVKSEVMTAVMTMCFFITRPLKFRITSKAGSALSRLIHRLSRYVAHTGYVREKYKISIRKSRRVKLLGTRSWRLGGH